jgi:hypothetical protein
VINGGTLDIVLKILRFYRKFPDYKLFFKLKNEDSCRPFFKENDESIKKSKNKSDETFKQGSSIT